MWVLPASFSSCDWAGFLMSRQFNDTDAFGVFFSYYTTTAQAVLLQREDGTKLYLNYLILQKAQWTCRNLLTWLQVKAKDKLWTINHS